MVSGGEKEEETRSTARQHCSWGQRHCGCGEEEEEESDGVAAEGDGVAAGLKKKKKKKRVSGEWHGWCFKIGNLWNELRS